uniref:Uncharacterized protein n=1 Tax=Rhizophagus irregularis (strain DAOM 181602 / DAOM 197198 / MUCL 43194) TaxID=747089 RepID=U9UA43_RHIID
MSLYLLSYSAARSLFFVSKSKGNLRLVNSQNNTPRLYISAFSVKVYERPRVSDEYRLHSKKLGSCKVLHHIPTNRTYQDIRDKAYGYNKKLSGVQ